MSKEDMIVVDGTILDVLPNQTYKIEINDPFLIVMAYTGGRMRQNKIQLVIGDVVKVEMSPYDLTKGRVVQRY